MEELYIEDWVKYHLSIGIDKIIINDNNDDDYPVKLKDILKEYIDSGKVVIEYYYKDHILKSERRERELGLIYTWLYDKYKSEFDWAAKLDIDEYLEIPETNNDIKNFLIQDKFKNYDTILLSWIGKNIDDNLPEEYRLLYFPIPIQERCTNIKYTNSNHFKCIVKSLNKQVVLNHHIPFLSENKMCLTNGISLQEALINKFCEYRKYNNKSHLCVNFNNAIKLSKYAYINHYRHISLEEEYYKHIKIFDTINKNIYDKKYKPRNLYKVYLNSK